MYKLFTGTDKQTGDTVLFSISRLTTNSSIPINSQNGDYQKFKKHMEEGKELQDADGVTLTAEQVQELLATLP